MSPVTHVPKFPVETLLSYLEGSDDTDGAYLEFEPDEALVEAEWLDLNRDGIFQAES